MSKSISFYILYLRSFSIAADLTGGSDSPFPSSNGRFRPPELFRLVSTTGATGGTCAIVVGSVPADGVPGTPPKLPPILAAI